MSLTGIFPLGVFLIQHLYFNSFVLISEEAFNARVLFLARLPLGFLLEVLLIFCPLLLHAAIGISLACKAENNFTQYSLLQNWMFFFQRLSGFLALVFIGTHIALTRFSSLTTGRMISFETLHQQLSDPWWFLFHAVGVISVIFHLTNGFWNFLITWGITIGPKSQKISASLNMFFFIILSTWALLLLARISS